MDDGWQSDLEFRRFITLTADDGLVTADLEDNFHHFELVLHHDGSVVTSCRGTGRRIPWVPCAEAGPRLEALRGLTLSDNPTAPFRYANAREHCTHLFDLAALAVCQAARGMGTRRYEAIVRRLDDGRRRAELLSDGTTTLEWLLDGDTILEPCEFAGGSVDQYSTKALRDVPGAEAERLFVLRRAVGLQTARGLDLDAVPAFSALSLKPQCFTLQPGNIERSVRIKGTVRGWTGSEWAREDTATHQMIRGKGVDAPR